RATGSTRAWPFSSSLFAGGGRGGGKGMPEEVIRGYRLSPQQRRLWLHQRRLATQFLVQGAVLMEGKTDREGIRRALVRLIERPEVLGTMFNTPAGKDVPLQVVCEHGLLCLREMDSDESETNIEQMLRDQRREPFDLEKGPLVRFILHRLVDNRQLLILTLP